MTTTATLDMSNLIEVEKHLESVIGEYVDQLGVMDTESMRYVLWLEASTLIDVVLLPEVFGQGMPLDRAEFYLREHVDGLLREPLKLKAIHAYIRELFVSDPPPLDGILGQALDQAEVLLRPYSKDVAGPFAT